MSIFRRLSQVASVRTFMSNLHNIFHIFQYLNFLWFREILGKECISSYISDYHLTIQNYSWEEMEWEIKGNVLFGSHHLEEVCNR